MKIEIRHSSPEPSSFRAASVASLFNAEGPPGFALDAELPLEDRDWQIGLVMGPSGSGKTSIGRALWGRKALAQQRWPKDAPVIDAIAPGAQVNEVTAALSAVGLGTVPSWLRPYRVLSAGEQFRASLARLLCERPSRVVLDEFTSVVDRRVATIGAAAFAKAWRRGDGREQLVALSCHRDILDWLQPDWVYDTERAEFAWRRLRRPPSLAVEIVETDWRYWPRFEPHHYLKLPRMIAATCYVGFCEGAPVAHLAVSTRPGLREARACRLVVMPEWQGAGVGIRFLNEIAALWRRGINRYGRPMPTLFHTSHPGLASALRRDPLWVQISAVLHGDNKGKSRRSLAASAARGRFKKGENPRGGYGGHFRAVQGFRYVEGMGVGRHGGLAMSETN